jgi:hypothetical protein
VSAGQHIVEALTAAGWTPAGGRAGAYTRMQWRDAFGLQVMVPLDETAPEYEQMLDAAITTIGRIADWGGSAQRALERLTEQGVIV